MISTVYCVCYISVACSSNIFVLLFWIDKLLLWILGKRSSTQTHVYVEQIYFKTAGKPLLGNFHCLMIKIVVYTYNGVTYDCILKVQMVHVQNVTCKKAQHNAILYALLTSFCFKIFIKLCIISTYLSCDIVSHSLWPSTGQHWYWASPQWDKIEHKQDYWLNIVHVSLSVCVHEIQRWYYYMTQCFSTIHSRQNK